MIFLAGWIGGTLKSGDEHPVVEAMESALLRGVTRQGLKHVGDHRGLIVADDVAEDGERLAGVSGYPRWADDDLAAIARRDGHGAALLAGFARHGAGVLAYLKDAFTLAVVDRETGRVLAAIDRGGIGSLAWGRAGDGATVIATSADAVAAYPAMTATVRPQAVYEYLFHYAVPAPLTIYEEQQKLLPAQCLEGVGGDPDLAIRFYWEMPYTSERKGVYEEWAERFRTQIRASFARTIEGVPVEKLGAFLSGGLDSSTVTGLLSEVAERPRSFTIGFDEPKYDERPFARAAAQRFGARYHEYVPTPRDVLDLMPKIAEVYDEPYGNTSAIPAYLCARMAKEAGVQVMLAGDGGDEIFAGNERYAYMKRVERYGLIPVPVRKYLLEPVLALPGVDRLPLAGKAARLARRYAIPMPDRLYSFGYMLGADAKALFTQEWFDAIDPAESLAGVRAVYNRPRAADLLQRMMALDLKITLADNDLRKVSRMCALAGVEVRYPMLEDDLMNFAASIPSELLLPGDRLRDFFKRAMTGFLPDEIIHKTKHGFGLPFEHWIKEDAGLRDAVQDLLGAAERRSIFNQSFIRTVRHAALAPESSPFDGMAWDLAMLETWLSQRPFISIK